MTGVREAVEDLTEDRLPAALACWDAHRARSPLPEPQAAWSRPLSERRATVEVRLRAAIRAGRDGVRARVFLSGDAVLAYLAGRFVRLPRGTPYRAYAPDDGPTLASALTCPRPARYPSPPMAEAARLAPALPGWATRSVVPGPPD